jgi:hypothetical protein
MASTPEMRFLALCLPRTPGEHRQLTADTASLDWPLLLDLARRQGMTPLLASAILPSGSRPRSDSAAPAFVIADLRAYQERHLFRTLTQTAALVELQRAFAGASLKILPWKGASVGALLYGTAILRESVDLDFLFREEDIQSVLELTRSLGYRLLGSSASESKDVYVFTLQREFTFGRDRDQVVLEFHLQILPSRFTLWQDSRADIERASLVYSLAGVRLLMQRPEDLLVGLCAHATKHNWDRMKWSCDIAQFLRVFGKTIDWTSLFLQLRQARKDSVVLLGISLAGKLFDLQLPPPVVAALEQAPAVVALASDLATHMMGNPDDYLPLHHRKEIIALLCPRLRDRIAYTLRPILELNYEDLLIPVQNRRLFFLNYLVRVVRLLRKYGPQRLVSKTAVSVRSVH